MSARISPELVAEAKYQAELKIDAIRSRCAVNRTGDPKDCTCPSPMPSEDEFIAEHLNFALSVMEKR